jgi:uncharacterized membrane protein YeaQ/YmgE (transglycosylase-associated protein family)
MYRQAPLVNTYSEGFYWGTGLTIITLTGNQSKRRKKRGATMSIIVMLIIGLIAGAIAKLLMPGKDPGGIVITMLLGIAGSIVAGFLGRLLGLYRDGETAGFIASIVGAVLLLAIYRSVTGRGRTASV